MPPPPVGGAAAGNELAAGLGAADELAAGLGAADELAEGLALALGVAALAVPLGGIVGVAEALVAGDNVGGAAEGEDVQAETDAETSMAKMAQLAAVNLALSPAPTMIVRIFMGSPHASGRWRTVSRSRVGREIAGRPGRCPRRLKARPPEGPSTIKVMPMDRTDM